MRARGAVDRLRRQRGRQATSSLPVRQGEVLALIGPSGCGKTTLLRSLNRLDELTPGARARRAASRSTARTSTRSRSPTLRRRVSMVFQQPNPFPMSIFDNVAYALREQARKRPGRARRSSRCVEDALRRAGLWDEVERQPRPSRAAPLRRPAAAAVHRPRARRAARGPAARRAVLGARPALDRGDRGADRRAARASWRS